MKGLRFPKVRGLWRDSLWETLERVFLNLSGYFTKCMSFKRQSLLSLKHSNLLWILDILSSNF